MGLDGQKVQSRVVEYTHPVNVPMAPPSARAQRKQTFQRYGDHGFCIETECYVEDVPMTDCFFVKDRLLVAAKEGGKVLVTLEFELEFVKSTMYVLIFAFKIYE